MTSTASKAKCKPEVQENSEFQATRGNVVFPRQKWSRIA